MIEAMGVLMGVDLSATTRPEGSGDEPPRSASPPSPSAATTTSSAPKPAPPPAEDVEMEGVDEEEAKAKKEAEGLKKAGGEAYKKRDFDEAIKAFQKAWDTWPKDITFLTNLGGGSESRSLCYAILDSGLAAYFEQGEYDKAIEVCQKAVEEGRDVSGLRSSLI